MNIKLLKPDSYNTSTWSGGSTTQIAIFPQGADYQERDFLWRISSARVELPVSDFTPLPDYERHITVIQGGMRLRHEGGDEISLSPYDIHKFDGGAKTVSIGECLDFNLMTRKGKAEGDMKAVTLIPGMELSLEAGKGEALALYCSAGKASLKPHGIALRERETALIFNCDEALSITGDGRIIACSIKSV